MTQRFLLDTNVLSEPLRPSPDQGVMEALRRHDRFLATAAPVWHELWFGCRRLPPSRRRSLIEDYLQGALGGSLPVLPYDASAAAWHSRERARLSKRGRPPPFVDGQIAAVAAVNDLVLVTANTADYTHFEGLEVIDWRTGPTDQAKR